jgi:hypothetical protein
MKKLLITIAMSLTTMSSFAVTPVMSSSQNQQTDTTPIAQEKWMKQRTGRILVFDKTQGVVIVNKKAYGLTKSTQIYDGFPKRGSSIKFNLDKNNNITELWITSK